MASITASAMLLLPYHIRCFKLQVLEYLNVFQKFQNWAMRFLYYGYNKDCNVIKCSEFFLLSLLITLCR